MWPPSRWSERSRTSLSIAAIAAAIVFVIWAGGLFQSVRLRATDVFFIAQNDAAPEAIDQITLIALDDASFQTYGRTLTEWDRAVYGDLVDRLAGAGARVVAFDLIFSESSASDDQFADALARARESDARTRFVFPIAGLGEPLPPGRQFGGGLSDSQRIGNQAIRFASQLRPVTALADRADYLAYVNTLIDVDGVVRRQPSLIQGEGDVRYGFSLATYLAWLRIPEAAAAQVIASVPDSIRIADGVTIPRDDLGLWRQEFYGRPGQSFAVHSLVDVLNGGVPDSAFADRVVLIGLMNSQGAADVYNIPIDADGQFMAGVEILGHALATLMVGSVPLEQPTPFTAIMLLALIALCSVVMPRLTWVWKVVLAVGLLILLFIVGSVNFSVRRELISLFDGALAIVIPSALAFGYEIRSERRSRRRAETLFESAEGQRRLIDTIFQRSPLPILVADADLRLIRGNAGFDSAFSGGSIPIPANTLLTALLTSKGMTEENQRKLVASIRAGDGEPLKVAIGEGTWMVSAAPLDESGARVITFSDVTELQDLTALKTRLIRIAAHDVRNPLSSIIGFTDLILIGRESLPKRVNEMLDRIRSSASTINAIMTNILKLEQLRSATLPLEPVSLTLLASQVATGISPEMERRRHDFIIDIPEGDLMLTEGEPVQLGQAISNLLSNAAKYTPDGGRVRLNVVKGTSTARVEVIDNGHGISKADQQQLFTEFYRVRTSATSKIDGTGLGLSLVRTIIESHRGRVWVESDEGKGSTFSIELPLMENPPDD